MTNALAHQRATRAAALGRVTLFVTMSDSEMAEAIERRSAARLNPSDLVRAFANRSDRS